MKSSATFLWVAVWAAVPLCCVSAQPAPKPRSDATTNSAASTRPTTPAPEGGASSNITALAASHVGAYVLDDKHKLAAGDKISFRILEDRDPAVSRTVTDSTELDVPYVGPVSVANKTCKQLAQELKDILEKEYYYRASVVLSIDSVSKMRGKIYIYGQVKIPGAIELPTEENFTVAKAILRAGGFGEFADKKAVTVFHTTPEGVKQKTILNMQEIFEQGKAEKDVTLQDEDSIFVPEKRFNF